MFTFHELPLKSSQNNSDLFNRMLCLIEDTEFKLLDFSTRQRLNPLAFGKQTLGRLNRKKNPKAEVFKIGYAAQRRSIKQNVTHIL